ncbi:MAG: EAL domain-containing protein [Solirubrobacterales bacterium]|nr:EAL domain-containing protein [Solirubrobacterales bacterium]
METPHKEREQPPDRVLMARVGAYLFLGGALIAATGLIVPTPTDADESLLAVIGAGAGLASALLFLHGRRLPAASFPFVTALGTGLITMAAVSFGGAPLGGDAEVLYLLPGLFAGYFFSRRAAAIQVGLIALAYGGFLVTAGDATAGDAIPRWIVTVGTVGMATLLIWRMRQRADADLAARHETASLLEATLESTADGILVVDTEGSMVSLNGKFVEMWRIPASVVDSRDDDRALEFMLDQIRHPDRFLDKVRELYDQPDATSFDLLEFKDGRIFERYSQPRRHRGEHAGRVWSFRDVTESKLFETRLQHLADHDPLTDLFNRRRFEQEVERESRLADRHGLPGAVLIIDLDNFKYANDTLGHGGGDELIRSVGRILRAALRETDILARHGGDEFAVLLPRATTAEADRVSERLLRSVREQAIAVSTHRIRITTSIGMATYESAGLDAPDLLVAADQAMYEAKEAGRDRIVTYSPNTARKADSEARLAWSQRIRDALDEDDFSLYAQPILDLKKDRVDRYEVLVRMTGENAEPILPGAFLSTAERFGLIGDLDRWVIRHAIELIAENSRRGEDFPIGVNISGHSLADPELPSLIRDEVREKGIDPSRLIFEVTETAAIASMDRAREFAAMLTELGCSFALDDFGSGFNSFYYLKHFPIDFLKIDGDFIQDLPDSSVDQLVVKSMVEIASGLGVRTIAEFANSPRTVELLRELGVDYAQGYAIGRPRPAAEVWPLARASAGAWRCAGTSGASRARRRGRQPT